MLLLSVIIMLKTFQQIWVFFYTNEHLTFSMPLKNAQHRLRLNVLCVNIFLHNKANNSATKKTNMYCYNMFS